MESLRDYDTDPMTNAPDEIASTSRNSDGAPSIANLFRINSICLASFPWSTVIAMVPSKLIENIGDEPEKHYSFVSYQFNGCISSIYRVMAFNAYYFLSFFSFHSL